MSLPVLSILLDLSDQIRYLTVDQVIDLINDIGREELILVWRIFHFLDAKVAKFKKYHFKKHFCCYHSKRKNKKSYVNKVTLALL